MNLTPIKANMTELDLDNGIKVLFSYKTPVAYTINSPEGRSFYHTEKKWSRTTTRHIRTWLPIEDSMALPQEKIEEFVNANVGVK